VDRYRQVGQVRAGLEGEGKSGGQGWSGLGVARIVGRGEGCTRRGTSRMSWYGENGLVGRVRNALEWSGQSGRWGSARAGVGRDG